jgi:AraC-like DNA-binding protein
MSVPLLQTRTMSSTTGGMFARHPAVASRDLDEAREALSLAYLPMEFFGAPAAVSVDMLLNIIKVGRVTAGYMQFGDSLGIKTIEVAHYHLAIPVDGTAKMQSGSREPINGSRHKAALFPTGLPVSLDCDAEFVHLALMFPKTELQFELESLLGRCLKRPLEFASELDLSSVAGRTLLQTLHLIDTASQDDDGLLSHPIAAHRIEQVLMQNLLLAQPHNYSEALQARPPLSGRSAVTTAVDLMHGQPAHPWRAAELAEASYVSVRSLQESFRKSLGTSPMRYLGDLRLAEVRQELAAAAPGALTVSQAASRWGFTHLGRFAAAYRRRFGELPSDTLHS